MLKSVLLLSGSGSAISEVRVTSLDTEPSVEALVVPVILIVSLSGTRVRATQDSFKGKREHSGRADLLGKIAWLLLILF